MNRRIISLFLVLSFIIVALTGCGLFDSDVESIELSETQLTISVGDSVSIDVNIQPSNASSKVITWTTTNTNVVTVDNGVVYAMGEGIAAVKATAENGVSKSCNITVTGKEITEVSLDTYDASVKAGKTVTIKATVTPSDASGTLTWSSDDSGIAKVNSKGVVTGVKAGSAVITCTAPSGVFASCTIKVTSSSSSTSTSGKTTIPNSGSDSGVTNNYYFYSDGGIYRNGYVYSENDFVFPHSSVSKLSSSEINSRLSVMSGYSPSGSYAQDAINEIYARNGYAFKTAEIRSYYESTSWYYADPTFSTSDFNEVEKYNIDLLSKYQ